MSSGTQAVDASLFSCPLTFMGVRFGHDLSDARVAVVGIPFDVGTDANRIGARHGPSAIRAQSGRIGRHAPPEADVDILRGLGVVDCGDVQVIPSYLEAAQKRIEAAIGAVLDADAAPFTMGGDGTVTLPQLRAVSKRHSDLAVLHIDAHTDAMPGEGRVRATGTTFVHAANEGLVDTSVSMHVGVRGPHRGADVYGQSDALGYVTVDFAALRARGIASVLDEVCDRMCGRAVYVCWDMDFFDPAYAPGVCAPTPGGATSAEGIELAAGLAALDVVAVDVNTVSPPHDPAGTTEMLAARVLFELMVARWRRDNARTETA
jgi:agmatinase